MNCFVSPVVSSLAQSTQPQLRVMEEMTSLLPSDPPLMVQTPAPPPHLLVTEMPPSSMSQDHLTLVVCVIPTHVKEYDKLGLKDDEKETRPREEVCDIRASTVLLNGFANEMVCGDYLSDEMVSLCD
jgi:hypothetical protein